MKLKLYIITLLALFVASCTREGFPESNNEQGERLVTISATIPSDTKVSYNDGTLKLAWETGDQLMLVGYDDDNVYKGHKVFTYVAGSNDNFTGETVSGATIYKAYYPAAAVKLDENYGAYFDKLWQQTQDGNNSTTHLGDKLCLCDELGHAINQPFTLNSKNNILRLNLTGIPADLGTLQRLIWTVEYETGKTRSTSLDFTNYMHTGSELIAFLTFDPIVTKIAAGGNVKITLIGDKSYEWKTPTPVANGKTYTQGNTRYYASVSQGWYEVAPLMYTIRTNDPQTEHGINQPYAPSTNPANLTIYWGDGTENTFLAQNSALSEMRIASHNYTGTGDYTVTIISDQADTLSKQMPRLTFDQQELLTAVLTPFPNMDAPAFGHTFYKCIQLTTIPADLFRYNVNVTSFNGLFRDCASLTTIPADLFEHNTLAESFQLTFLNCTGITELPAGLFSNNTQAEYFYACFKGCTSLTTIQGGLFGDNTNTTVTSFLECFNGCTALNNLPSGLFGSDQSATNTQATNFRECFNGCTSLTAVPEDLFSRFEGPISFYLTFRNCTALNNLPAGLFSNNTQATDFSSCFTNCSSLTEIPAELFRYNTNANSFQGCFYYCTGITTVPAGLFSNNEQAKFFGSCFRGCTGLTTVPAGLFSNNVLAESFKYCFMECSGLTNLPAELFRFNTNAKSFYGCFWLCTGLTNLPAELFSYNTQATDFTSCFQECTGLTYLPAELFRYNTNANSFQGCFYYCTGITTVPAGLFSNNTQATDFTFCFYSCIGLTTVPAGLFSNNALAESFFGCFSFCSELTTVPDGLFVSNSAATNFERCFYDCKKLVLKKEIFPLPTVTPDFFANRTMNFQFCFQNVGTESQTPGTAPELWLFTGGGAGTTWTITDCFTGATSLTNYNDIPNSWKGL